MRKNNNQRKNKQSFGKSLFLFYFYLLDDLQCSEKLALISIIISFLQNIGFLVSYAKQIGLFTKEVYLVISNIFSLFRPVYLLNIFSSISLYWVMILFSLFSVFQFTFTEGYIFVTRFFHPKKKSKLGFSKSKFYTKFFKIQIMLHYFLFFNPINDMILNPLLCSQNKKDLCMNDLSNTIFSVIGICFYIVHAIFNGFNVIIMMENKANHKNNFSRSNSHLMIIGFLVKNLLVWIIKIESLKREGIYDIVLSALFLVQLFGVVEFFRFHNFFNEKVDNLYGLTITLETWLTLYILLATIYKDVSSKNDTCLIFFIITILVIRLFLNLCKYFKSQYLMNIEIFSESFIDKKLKILTQTISKRSIIIHDYKMRKKSLKLEKPNTSEYIKFIGGIYDHYKNCRNKYCICKPADNKLYDFLLNSELLLSDNFHENLDQLVFLKYYIRQQYLDSFLHFGLKNNFSLKINLAYFDFYHLNNFHRALLGAFELKKQFSESITYKDNFLIKKLGWDIDKRIKIFGRDFNIERLNEIEKDFSSLEVK